MDIIQTSHLYKSYGKNTVVEDVSFTVKSGDIYGLVGRNGAGKTTLIRLILGLAEPNSGTVSINGALSRDGLAFERRKIGAIIDQPSYEPHLSAFENLKAAAFAQGIRNDDKLRALLNVVGLNANDSLPAKNFSLGMKQRLAIAAALLGEPGILILDEPVNGLDPTGIFEIRELLYHLNKEKGVTILISSHLLAELGKLATCYGIMDKGKLVKELRGSDLDELSRPFIKLIVGDLKTALNVIVENYSPHDFEILPYNTIAIYNLEKGVAGVAALMSEANVPVIQISQCEGDLEATFITMMGGLEHENR